MTGHYRGRFAPSPSGPLHLGSMMTALASWLEARHRGGEWLVRMEDLDRPRVRQAHADDILRTLERYGLYWDGPVLYQSTRDEAYAAATEALLQQDLLYACTCTRRELADSRPGVDGRVYPGTCRNNPPLRPQKHALRVRVDNQRLTFNDRVQGPLSQSLAQDVGDFILQRSDGLFAYQLAVVVDDAEQGITEVLRGADLLHSTPRQIFLQGHFRYHTPAYAHLPLLVDTTGAKLSKRDPRDPLSLHKPEQALTTCLALLGHPPPKDLEGTDVYGLLDWAKQNWNLSAIPRCLRLPAPAMA